MDLTLDQAEAQARLRSARPRSQQVERSSEDYIGPVTALAVTEAIWAVPLSRADLADLRQGDEFVMQDEITLEWLDVTFESWDKTLTGEKHPTNFRVKRGQDLHLCSVNNAYRLIQV